MPPKKIKQMNKSIPTYKQPLQHDVEKAQQKEKINPKKIFESSNNNNKKKKKVKVPKGSHRMPDGRIMKNSDMKKKKRY